MCKHRRRKCGEQFLKSTAYEQQQHPHCLILVLLNALLQLDEEIKHPEDGQECVTILFRDTCNLLQFLESLAVFLEHPVGQGNTSHLEVKCMRDCRILAQRLPKHIQELLF